MIPTDELIFFRGVGQPRTSDETVSSIPIFNRSGFVAVLVKVNKD